MFYVGIDISKFKHDCFIVTEARIIQLTSLIEGVGLFLLSPKLFGYYLLLRYYSDKALWICFYMITALTVLR
jgi:hypothetical protein